VCLLAISLKNRFGYDDSLDVIGVHLVGGLLGALLLGLFADTAVNELGYDGLLFGGGTELLVDQAVASAATFAYSFLASLLIAKVIDLAIGLRVSPEQELEGLDRSQHAETAYAFGSIASGLGTIVSHGSEADERSTVDV
jgi:Amt family ammonium transporter